MFTVVIPNNWPINDCRPVLRLVDRKTRKSKSIALYQGKSFNLLATDLPNEMIGEVVAWIDLVAEGNSTPLTKRVNLGSLRRLKALRAIIYRKNLTQAQEGEFVTLMEIANAWRWIQPEDVRDVYAISHDIIHTLSSIDLTEKGPIGRLVSFFKNSNNINDGSEISNQIVYIWSLCKIVVGAREALGASGFPTQSATATPEVELARSVASNLLLEIDKYTELPAPLAVAASLESIVSGRAKAENSYARIIENSSRSIQKTGALAGVMSYGRLGRHDAIYIPELKLLEVGGSLGDRAGLGRTTVIYSANPDYLRSYLMRLVYYVSLFPEYDYHIHLVGSETECLDMALCVLQTFQLNQSIRGKSLEFNHISFSFSEVPENVPEKVSYYASARFFYAAAIMSKTGSPVWIQDVDLFPTGDTLEFLNALKDHDVSLFISHYLHGAFPWIRYLAGNVFINNTVYGFTFLREVSAYLAEWLTVEESWTVDQNALAFAVESCGPGLDLADVRRMRIPLQQSALAPRIES